MKVTCGKLRALKEPVVGSKQYYHHKSGYDFKSTILVVEFLLHNRFIQTDRNSEPRVPENPPPLEEIGEESAKDSMLDELNLEGKFIPPLVLPPLPLEAWRPKRNDKRKSVPSNPSSSGKNGANGKEPVEAQPDSVPGAERLDATDIEQPPLASTVLTLEAPRTKRKYTRKSIPSEASSSKLPRKKQAIATLDAAPPIVSTYHKIAIVDVGPVFENAAPPIVPTNHEIATIDVAPIFGDTGMPIAEGPDHTSTNAPENMEEVTIEPAVAVEPVMGPTYELHLLPDDVIESLLLVNLGLSPSVVENDFADPTIDAAVVTTATEDQLAAEVMNQFVHPANEIESFKAEEADSAVPNDALVVKNLEVDSKRSWIFPESRFINTQKDGIGNQFSLHYQKTKVECDPISSPADQRKTRSPSISPESHLSWFLSSNYGRSDTYGLRPFAGHKPAASSPPFTSLWLPSNDSKRWAELFFLLYTPFWLTFCLGIIVPFKLYESFTELEYLLVGLVSAVPAFLIPALVVGKADRSLPFKERYWVKASDLHS
ncbi:Cycloeucalenol cycloisomerase [Linum perenne]